MRRRTMRSGRRSAWRRSASPQATTKHISLSPNSKKLRAHNSSQRRPATVPAGRRARASTHPCGLGGGHGVSKAAQDLEARRLVAAGGHSPKHKPIRKVATGIRISWLLVGLEGDALRGENEDALLTPSLLTVEETTAVRACRRPAPRAGTRPRARRLGSGRKTRRRLALPSRSRTARRRPRTSH